MPRKRVVKKSALAKVTKKSTQGSTAKPTRVPSKPIENPSNTSNVATPEKPASTPASDQPAVTPVAPVARPDDSERSHG